MYILSTMKKNEKKKQIAGTQSDNIFRGAAVARQVYIKHRGAGGVRHRHERNHTYRNKTSQWVPCRLEMVRAIEKTNTRLLHAPDGVVGCYDTHKCVRHSR